MKRSWPSLICGVVLAGMLILYMVTFQVRFTEIGIVRTFGKIREGDVVKDAGLYWKWPWPIQKVDKLDRRIQTTSTTGEEVPTRDGKNVVVTTTICWRIDDPYKFSIRCRSIKEAEGLIKNRIRNDQKTVLGNYNFSHFVSTDAKELKYDQIESEIAKTVQAVAADRYGVSVERVAIEELTLPLKVTETVIEAMKKERQAIAQRYTSEGESQAKQLNDTAESISGTIMAFANRKAAEILAEGQKRAVEYNKVFRQDEDLAAFLLQIENIPAALSDRATLILDQPEFVGLLRDEPTTGSGPTTRPAGPDRTAGLSAVPVVIETK